MFRSRCANVSLSRQEWERKREKRTDSAVSDPRTTSSRPCKSRPSQGRWWFEPRHCRRRDACAPSPRRRSVHGGRRWPRGGSAGSGGGEGGCLLRWNYPLTTARDHSRRRRGLRFTKPYGSPSKSCAIDRAVVSNQSTIPGTRRRRHPPREETEPHDVLGRERQAAARSGKSIITRVYACKFMRDAWPARSVQDVVTQGTKGYIHLRCTSGSRALLKPWVKGEDWELPNTHNRLLDRHGIPPVRYRERTRFISSSANSLLKYRQYLALPACVLWHRCRLRGCASSVDT